MSSELVFRAAAPHDAEAIAQLHAESWQRTYRGMLQDDYLDHHVLTDKFAQWQERLLIAPLATRWVYVAERDGAILGFACVLLDDDPQWGTQLDNLHVAAEAQGLGIGRKLHDLALAFHAKERPNQKIHLWTFAANAAARAIYQHWGWQEVEHDFYDGPGGSNVPSVRYQWALR